MRTTGAHARATAVAEANRKTLARVGLSSGGGVGEKSEPNLATLQNRKLRFVKKPAFRNCLICHNRTFYESPDVKPPARDFFDALVGSPVYGRRSVRVPSVFVRLAQRAGRRHTRALYFWSVSG